MKLLDHQQEAGFTLVELVVTATFIATVSLAIVGIFITINGLTRQSRNLATATQAAQKKIETYRNLGYQSIPATEDFTSSLPSDLRAPRGATATFSDFSPALDGLKELEVEIYYHEGSKRKEVKVKTYVTRNGINR